MGEVNPFEKALEEVDTLVASELKRVVRAMIDVAVSSEDDRARVTAAAKLLDYARPPKSNPLVNINLPTVVSALNLPPGAGPQKRNPKALEVQTVPKILPEPNTLHEAKFRGAFSAENPQQPAAPVFAAPAPLVAKSREPQKPAQPPPAGRIRPSEGS